MIFCKKIIHTPHFYKPSPESVTISIAHRSSLLEKRSTYLKKTEKKTMEDLDQFEEYRPLMFSIAYRMLGSVSEAEDMLQNAYVRYRQIETSTIASPKA